MSKIFVVVRTTGEETLDECLRALKYRDIPYTVLRDYKPLEKASKETIKIGAEKFKQGYDWVLAVDADVVMTMNREELEKYCDKHDKKFPEKWFCFCGYLHCTKRGLISGLHFFRTSECQKAYDLVKDVDFQWHKGREEYEICCYLRENHKMWWCSGYKELAMGVHYFNVNN